jgi:L-aminopeptidase/D-esterase-like protein
MRRLLLVLGLLVSIVSIGAQAPRCTGAVEGPGVSKVQGLTAIDGIRVARAIVPSHTMGDGDTIFTLATGARAGDPNISLIGALAADVMALATLLGVREATGLPGYPAVRDLVRQ